MLINKKPTREEALMHFSQLLDDCLQGFDTTSKVDMAANIVTTHRLNEGEHWISQLERRLNRKFSAINKFKIDILYRVYSFHGKTFFRGKGIGERGGRHVGEMFNE